MVAPYILLVDDDPSNLCVWEEGLSADFPVLTANGGARALSLLRELEVAVVVSDQRMPAMTGTDLLERVRADYPDAVRILITAYADMSAAVEAINRGHVRRFLQKPCSLSDLRREIGEAYDLYQLRARVRQMERRLLRTERVYALGVIATGLAREFEEPLTRIRNGLKNAREALTADVDALPATRTIQVERQLALVQTDVERVSRLTQGLQLPVTPEDETECVDLSDVLRMSLRVIRSEIKKHGDVQLDVHPVPLVRASGPRLGQVVLNLLVNAFESIAETPEREGYVTVRLGATGESVALEVIDNGRGPAPGDPDRLQWGGASATELGLAISRAIVEDSGGRLEWARRATGGMLYRVTLPAWKGTAESATGSSPLAVSQ